MKAKSKTCCVCNKPATKIHMSIIGQIPFHVCDVHYKSTSPAVGFCDKMQGNRMGLLDEDNNWVDLIRNEVIEALKPIE